MEDRLTAMEKDVALLRSDVAVIRSNYATKEDLAQVRADMVEAMVGQTWKIITWVTSMMALLSGIVFFAARNMH